MKKTLIILSAILIAAFAMILIIRPFSEKKNYIVVEKVVKKDGKVIARYKIAEPAGKIEKQKKVPDFVEGRVVLIANNPRDIYSKMMTGIQNDKEVIIVTNPDYVRTLSFEYFGQKVGLTGHWQKDAVIFGKKYRVFRVEDISLSK